LSRLVRERRRRTASVEKNLVGFVVGDVQYAIDILRVREIIRPQTLLALPHAPPAVIGVADHRSQVVPIVEVRRRFGLEPAPSTRRSKWILVEVDGRTVGLAVDTVTGVLAASDVDHRPPPALGMGDAARGIASVISHQSGLVFVLDVDRVAAAAQVVEVAIASRGGLGARPTTAPTHGAKRRSPCATGPSTRLASHGSSPTRTGVSASKQRRRPVPTSPRRP